MAMTKEERGTKNWLFQHLLEERYRTYAKLFWELDFHLTADPSVVGFMDPKTGTITVNRTLEADQISVIIRHEILHGFLQHEKRLLQNLAQKRGLDFDELSDMDINQLKSYLYKDMNFNIAGDYEISNLGYTEEDKDVVRNILLNGKTVHGLVTEDDHPDWVDLSIEEMYDKLQAERQNDQQQSQDGDREDPNEGDSTDQQSSSGQDSQQSNSPDSTQSQSDSGDQDNQSNNSDSSGTDNNQQSSNNKQNNQQQQGKQNQSSKNSQQQKSDQQDGGQGSSGTDSSTGSAPKYVYGKFVDKNTFLDSKGNVVTIG